MAAIQIHDNGTFTFSTDRPADRKTLIPSAPLGILVHEGRAHLPVSAKQDGELVSLSFPCGNCLIRVEDKGRYVKLTLCSVPDGTTGFVFGPYPTTADSFGEILGAGWYEDGSVVCIQSLMPKVEEGVIPAVREDLTGLTLNRFRSAASRQDGQVYLHCSVKDRTREEIREDGFRVQPIQGEDALVTGSSVALLYAESADELLDSIGGMELAEGLPHPVYEGQYAKKDKRVSSFYFVFDGPDMAQEDRIEAAKEAGVNCVYFSDLFEKWGHFTINAENFPGGVEEVRRDSDEAASCGIVSGAHSLSNFIHTNDEYVTPVPHEHLQIRDRTRLAREIDGGETEICLEEPAGYAEKSTLNVFRIGDELLTYRGFDAEKKRLTGCTRGAFGTKAVPHPVGSEVLRLKDHPYRTVFPDIVLQDEMAHRLGRRIAECGIGKMSFDGLEGCFETGHGKYAAARFVLETLSEVGPELMCDASIPTHYLWHAFSYNNWGEPFYDSDRRGGMHIHRTRNQAFFKRNLIPPMLGWYKVFLADKTGRFEATPPENMEYILSRSAAYDAGAALLFETATAKGHGLIHDYYKLIRRWNRFRLEADIPESVRERMREEKSDWHLEETADGWELTERVIRTHDLAYCDREVKTEGGKLGQDVSAEAGSDGVRLRHSSVFCLDGPYPSDEAEEPILFRIRVGKPGCGMMENLSLYGSLRFNFHADGGEYLVYEGGTTLYRYDGSYRLLETIEGEGMPFAVRRESPYIWGMVEYTTDDNPDASYVMTEFRKKQVWHIGPKAQSEVQP